MSKDPNQTGAGDPEGGGRRQGDRRKADVPFEGPDRRKSERRSPQDRRASPRSNPAD